MKELLQEFIKWAKKDNRYPLLFPLITPGIFLFVQSYFRTRSFAETLHHEAFLLCLGLILLISGLSLFLLDPKNRLKIFSGCSIAICGLVPIAYGISIMMQCKLMPGRIVVAVVEFDPGGNEAENDAIEIRDALWRKLQDSEKQGVPIIAKKLNKRISFNDSDEGSAAAKRIGNSKRTCAHLVIWGEVSREGSRKDRIAVVPYVTVAQNIPNMEIAEAQFLALRDTDVNFHKRKSGEIIDVVKYIGGLAYYKQGDWKNAIKLCKNVELYEAMIIHGMSSFMIGDYANSLTAFKNANRLKPNEVSYNALGMVYLQMKNYEKSKTYFAEAIETTKNNFAVINNLGLSKLSLGEYLSAVKDFNIALKLKNHPAVHSNLAFCLFELNRLKEAKKHWETSLELFSTWPYYPGMEFYVVDAKAGLAIGCFTNGDLSQAVDLYGKVVKKIPDYANIDKLENDFLWPPKAISKADELIKILKSKSQ